MNNNVENSVEETFDEMLDSVKSINDDFINNYFDNDKIVSINEEKQEENDIYDENSLKDLSNQLTNELFDNVEKPVENFKETEENDSLEQDEIPLEEEMIDLIDQTTSSEEFFDILEGKKKWLIKSGILF